MTKEKMVFHVAAVLQGRRDHVGRVAALKAFKDLMTERDSAEDRAAFDSQFFDALRSWSGDRVVSRHCSGNVVKNFDVLHFEEMLYHIKSEVYSMGRVRLGKRRMIGISETGYREVSGIMKRLQGIIDHSPAKVVEKLKELGYNTKHRLSLGSVVIAMSDIMRRMLDGKMIFISAEDIVENSPGYGGNRPLRLR